MTYPTSTDVIAGQATAAAHYNNLRNDALYLGNPVTDSDLLANLLAAYQSGITLQYLATNKVRVPASTAAPVRLMVGGYMLSAAANVDLAAAPSGGAMMYYVFAVRTAGSSTFTLAVNGSATESTTTRLIGQFYWTSTAITLLQSKQRVDSLTQTYDENTQVCQGRLTLSSGTPLTTADILTATTVYFTPYQGNFISLWEVGIGWHTLYFTELSLSIAGYTAGKNYDIFAYSNAGTPAIESLVWTSDTVRATALVLQDGRYVKSGDPTRLFLGTFRTTAVTGQTEDSKVNRFVANFYNPVAKNMLVDEITAHAYNGATRLWNGSSTNNLLSFVNCIANNAASYSIRAQMATPDGTGAYVLQYLNGSALHSGYAEISNSNAYAMSAGSLTEYFNPVVGLNTLQVYENGNNASSTFSNLFQSANVFC